MSKFDLDLEFETDNGNVFCLVTVEYYYHEGNWYDNNGEGCSPSSEMDYETRKWFDENGNEIEQPKEITESDVEELILNFLENQ